MLNGQYDLEDTIIGSEFTVPNSPAEVLAAQVYNDPFINAELNNVIDRAAMLGVDVTDPEIMGNIITDFFKKAGAGISKALKNTNIQITQPEGTTTISDAGVDFTSAQQQAAQVPVVQQPKTITDYLKNPYVLAGLIGIPLLIVIMKKRKKKRKDREE